MTDRVEVMWCVDCGGRFAQEDIEGWGCPECGSQGVPCDVVKDTTVEINWHELRILVIWAENWAQHHARLKTDHSSEKMPRTISAIARRLQAQRPDFGHLTLSGEIAALPSDLAKSNYAIEDRIVETIDGFKVRTNATGRIKEIISGPADKIDAALSASDKTGSDRAK